MWLIIGFSRKLDLSKFKHAQRIWLKRLIVFQRNELTSCSLDHIHNTRDLVCFSKMTLVFEALEKHSLWSCTLAEDGTKSILFNLLWRGNCFLVSQSPSQLSGTQRLVPIYSLLWNQKPWICIFKAGLTMSDYLAFSLYMQRLHEKHPQKPFHLTSHCDYWYWWYTLTMSWMGFSCIYVLVHIFKVGFTVSSVLEPLWPFHPYFARCCNEDGACCSQQSTPWFHGSSFLGFSHLVHAMDSKWDFKSSHLFAASSQLGCLHEICGWETGLPARSSWSLAGVVILQTGAWQKDCWVQILTRVLYTGFRI